MRWVTFPGKNFDAVQETLINIDILLTISLPIYTQNIILAGKENEWDNKSELRFIASNSIWDNDKIIRENQANGKTTQKKVIASNRSKKKYL